MDRHNLFVFALTDELSRNYCLAGAMTSFRQDEVRPEKSTSPKIAMESFETTASG
jgi:hypothetical protein